MTKTILITGTSSGIGKAIANLFSTMDWNVIATMRSPEKETQLTKLPNVLVTKLDVRDPETIENSIQSGIQRFGKIDVIVNNAAYRQHGIFEAISVREIRDQFETNVFGVMNVTRTILPYFRKIGGGMIINISSAAGRIGLPQSSVYSASKFAIEGFSESLYYELASQNIVLKIIEPGVVNTPFFQKPVDMIAANHALASYDEFVKKASVGMEYMLESITPPYFVADVVFEAATDNRNILRYQSGNDAKEWIKARTSLADKDYMEYMAGVVGLKPEFSIY